MGHTDAEQISVSGKSQPTQGGQVVKCYSIEFRKSISTVSYNCVLIRRLEKFWLNRATLVVAAFLVAAIRRITIII